jgi:MFS-type transporter involved in bile tolerance (Atg22 family)
LLCRFGKRVITSNLISPSSFLQLSTSVAYFLISLQSLNPTFPILLLSFSYSIYTAFTLAEISRIISWQQAGTAFGIVEIIDAIASFLGNILFGMIATWTEGYTVGSYGIMVASIAGNIVLLIYWSKYRSSSSYTTLA